MAPRRLVPVIVFAAMLCAMGAAGADALGPSAAPAAAGSPSPPGSPTPVTGRLINCGGLAYPGRASTHRWGMGPSTRSRHSNQR